MNSNQSNCVTPWNETSIVKTKWIYTGKDIGHKMEIKMKAKIFYRYNLFFTIIHSENLIGNELNFQQLRKTNKKS